MKVPTGSSLEPTDEIVLAVGLVILCSCLLICLVSLAFKVCKKCCCSKQEDPGNKVEVSSFEIDEEQRAKEVEEDK